MTASTAIITDATTVQNGTPTALSVTASNAAAGPITDLGGMQREILLKAQELKVACTALKAALDSGDSIYTTVSNILLTLT